MTKPVLYCAFCGKRQEEVAKLIVGAGMIAICNGCVTSCVDICADGSLADFVRDPSDGAVRVYGPYAAHPAVVQRHRDQLRIELERGRA